MPTASVIVPVFQAEKTLEACLQALSVIEFPSRELEIIVVDDGSTDSSIKIAENMEGVRLIKCAHAGRPAALNRGLEAAAGDIVLFTDADCLVPADWAGRLISLLEDNPKLSGVGGNMLPLRLNAVELAKVLPYLHEFSQDHLLEGTYTSFCLNGNNMAIKRNVLLEIGGFSEGYLHGADADLTRRLLESGHRLLRTADSLVIHLKQESLTQYLYTRFYRGSTIRFVMHDRRLRRGDFLRSAAYVFREFFGDFIRLGDLAAIGRKVPMRSMIGAPFAGLLGGAANWLGQVHHYRKYRREIHGSQVDH